MSHFSRITTIVLTTLALAVPALGTPADDVQQVRKVLQQEQESWRSGNVEQLMSLFAPGFVGYDAWGGRFALVEVSHVGLDSLRANYAEGRVQAFAASLKKHPERVQRFEVLHVNVKDDRAIALTKHAFGTPDTTAREFIFNEHESLWMLAKLNGTWKITGFVGQISFDQKVFKQDPE